MAAGLQYYLLQNMYTCNIWLYFTLSLPLSHLAEHTSEREEGRIEAGREKRREVGSEDSYYRYNHIDRKHVAS